MKSRYLTVRELAEYLGIAENAIHQRILRKQIAAKYLTKIEGQRGGKAGINYLISEEYLREVDIDAYARYIGDRLGSEPAVFEPTDLQGLSEWQLEKARERFKHVKKVKQIRVKSHKKQTQMIEEYAQKASLSRATLTAWEKAYDAGGLRGLVPGHGANKGKRISMHPRVQAFVEAEFLRPERPSIMVVWERLRPFCGRYGFNYPSYNTVRSFIRDDINFETKTLYREGEKAWKVKCEPFIDRNLNAYEPNEIWVVDSREMDVFVYIDKKKEVAIRPWLILAMDLGSRKFTGWRLCLQPDSWQIALAYRDGFLRNGIPAALYIDNGKDYRSYYLTRGVRKQGKFKMNIQTESVLLNLKIDLHTALPYNPQSKPIEPAFRIFHRLEKECPGWCGKDNKEKPEKFEKEQKARAFLTFEEFHTLLAEHIEWYNNRPHRELGLSPNQRRRDESFVTVDERDLDLLLMKKTGKTIHRNGIHHLGLNWWSEELQERTYIRDHVNIRYSPDDLTRIRVYRGDHFLCYAYPVEDIPPNATEKDMQRIQRRKRRAKERVKSYPVEREIVFSHRAALESVVNETVKAPDLGRNVKDQGPVDPKITHTKLTKGTALRADEEGREPYGSGGPLVTVPDDPAPGRERPEPPSRKRPSTSEENDLVERMARFVPEETGKKKEDDIDYSKLSATDIMKAIDPEYGDD